MFLILKKNKNKRRQKLKAKDFEPIAIIGRGAFGEVRLCKWKTTGEIVAIKKMKKSDMINKNQITHVRAERNILAASQTPWIVDLQCSFQVKYNIFNLKFNFYNNFQIKIFY